MSINGAPVMAASVVAVDVGKNIAALTVTDADRHRLFGPVDFAMTAPVTRFLRFAANRGLRVRRSAAERLVAAARAALPAPEAVVARQVLADDLGLLAELGRPDRRRGSRNRQAVAGHAVRSP